MEATVTRPSKTDMELGRRGSASVRYRGDLWLVSWHHCGAKPVRVECCGKPYIMAVPRPVLRAFHAAGRELGIYPSA